MCVRERDMRECVRETEREVIPVGVDEHAESDLKEGVPHDRQHPDDVSERRIQGERERDGKRERECV